MSAALIQQVIEDEGWEAVLLAVVDAVGTCSRWATDEEREARSLAYKLLLASSEAAERLIHEKSNTKEGSSD